MPSPADDLRALLAEDGADTTTLWLRRGHWMMQHGAAVVALLDAAQDIDELNHQADDKSLGDVEWMQAYVRLVGPLAAAVERLTKEQA